jgi:hypothetical protein
VILTLLVAVVDTMQTPDRRCHYTGQVGAPTSDCCSPHTIKHPSVSSGHDKGTCWRMRFHHCPTDNSRGSTGDSWFTSSLTVGLGVHRRVGASACIQRNGACLPDWSYHTSSSEACSRATALQPLVPPARPQCICFSQGWPGAALHPARGAFAGGSRCSPAGLLRGCTPAVTVAQ